MIATEIEQAGRRTFVQITLIAIVALCVVLSVPFFFNMKIEIGTFTLAVGKLFLALTAGTLLGLLVQGKLLRSVNETDWAIVKFFGKSLFVSEPGPILIIPGIMSLTLYPKQRQVEQYPADTDSIFWGEDDQDVPPGKSRAIRIPTGSKSTVRNVLKASDKKRLQDDDLHQNRLVLGTSWIIEFHIDDPIQFDVNVGDLELVKTRMNDASEAKLASEYSRRTPAMILEQKDELSTILEGTLNKLVNDAYNEEGTNEGPGSWGVKVTGFWLLTQNLSHDLSKAMRDKTKAFVEKQTLITKSEGQKQEKILLGEGDAEAKRVLIEKTGKASADAEKLMLLARAEGYAHIAEKLGISEKDLILKLEMAKASLKESDYNLITAGGLSDLFALIPGAQNLLQGAVKNKKEVPNE